ALAPVDARQRVASFVAAKLPEGLTLADTAATVHALRHGRGDSLGRDQQRRQRRGKLLRPMLQRGGLGHQRNGATSRSMICVMVTPSARAAKLSAMRWRNTGAASATTSSMEGASRASSKARARQASISAWLARGPGPQATCCFASATL